MTAAPLSTAFRSLVGLGGVFTSAKSFEDNPVLSSRWLNQAGLHAARVTWAHRVAASRRARLAPLVSAENRAAFARDGYILKPDFAPDLGTLVAEVKSYRAGAREMIQGDTLTRKIALDKTALDAMPTLRALVESAAWRNLLAYVGGMTARPVQFIQTIATHITDAPPDPQTYFHADTFHPAMKAWLFLNDVEGDVPPFTFVPGSHRLTPSRLDWERQQALIAAQARDEHTRQGSFRIDAAALAAMGLPEPRQFRVKANTLIVADTFGYHARGPSAGPAMRVEIWAYGRRAPFFPAPPRIPLRFGADAYHPREAVSAFDPA
ncbi:MAG: hypothetical protein ACREFC_15345 [Stellaceae bacterium]